MNSAFLMICCISLVFFVTFLLRCSKLPRLGRREKVRKLAQSEPIQPVPGHRFLLHLEKQMAEFVSAGSAQTGLR